MKVWTPGLPGRPLHLIQSEEEMQELSVSSKLNSEWVFLQHLHDIGCGRRRTG